MKNIAEKSADRCVDFVAFFVIFLNIINKIKKVKIGITDSSAMIVPSISSIITSQTFLSLN